jgi:hypothetical protein
MKRILIGGLGRSGTTITLNALYRHAEIYAVPIETKFLVEEDGFADLVSALTDRFSIGGATAACQRFEHLMRRQVTGLEEGKFRQQHTLSSEVFHNYEAALDAFLSTLSRRHFPHPAPLMQAVRTFIAATFEAETRRSGKAAWAEKTPANVWRLGFLRALWPDCWFVHAVRDPRAVLASLMRRRWMPREMLPAAVMFEGHLAALCEVRRRHAQDPRFIEMRLEDLVADPAATLDRLASRLALTPFGAEAVAALREAMDAYYEAAMPDEPASQGDHALMVELLRPAAIELGYPSAWPPHP